MIREGRLAKGFTQKELSQLSNISVRSIQRIENAELVPRSYTLKTLAGILDLSFDALQKEELSSPLSLSKKNTAQKIILSVGIVTAIILLAAAFISQAASFPETQFELINFITVIVLLITSILFFVWKK